MTPSVFGATYAMEYDLLYAEKDYRAECDLLEDAFRRYGRNEIRTVLDLGCGTGNHAIPLAQRGYRVTGVDRSEEMLKSARAKAAQMNASVVWQEGDIRTIHVAEAFDAALLMFAVLGYQLENKDVLAALRTVHSNLRPNGLLIFDMWYGPAVLKIGPTERIKVTPSADGQLIRAAIPTLDVRRQVCRVQYHLWMLRDKQVVRETEEAHSMRFFFPIELELMLDQIGFELLSLTAFPSLERPADETSWNALVIARRV